MVTLGARGALLVPPEARAKPLWQVRRDGPLLPAAPLHVPPWQRLSRAAVTVSAPAPHREMWLALDLRLWHLPPRRNEQRGVLWAPWNEPPCHTHERVFSYERTCNSLSEGVERR